MIQHHFIWNEITNDICVYVATCSVCQDKVIHHHKFYDQLESFSVLKNTWNSSFKKIRLDWITEFLSLIKNSQEYNNILIIVCCVIKYVLFIFTQNNCTAADFTKLFFEHVECYFDFSKNIVTDRNSHITSDFWWEVCKIQIIKQQLSTVYHSQTDDQNEALNQIIENYLRVYIFENQTVWTKLLFLVQFVYNNSCNHTIQMSLNRLLHGFDCKIHIDVTDNVIEKRISAAKDCVEKLHKLLQKLCLWLVKAQEWMTVYYNVCHVLKQFKIEDLVKLSTKNLKLKYQKLNFYWIELFRMLEQINEQTYRLALSSKYAHLYSVFSIQLLEDYYHHHNDTELMIMSDFENFQNE